MKVKYTFEICNCPTRNLKKKINEHQYTFHLKVYKNEGKIPSKWRLEAPKPKKRK